ncbi:HAMP domain-containing sensor histidine kinase [Pelomonas sp. KK5]|uniref:sensor histidine kinase n=1 Tax=Pelomonas sp. KK5 TaxID=1855730 RepID=UPI00097C1354|nr:HAMP domain-containing sensor histidine kinase [Pelomonas sp. KK5]
MSLLRRFALLLSKWVYTLGIVLGALSITGLLLFALYDWVTSARASEQQVRENTLSAELSNFLLSTREPDGSSLLENPQDFSLAERPMRFVQLRKSFFSYVLNRENARRLTSEKIVWDSPRPCTLEFAGKENVKKNGKDVGKGTADALPFTVQACFAAVPGEATGRFGYFAIRYPVEQLRRHRTGASVVGVDRIVLRFGAKLPPVVLVYRTPALAVSRYPSQLERFAGIHEMAAFLASAPERPLRQFNAQAFERAGEGEDVRNYVTVLGRIDATFLDPQAESSETWPSPALGALAVGIDVYRRGADGIESVFTVAPNTKGRALVSLQGAYLSSVPSQSALTVIKYAQGKAEPVWRSADLHLPTPPRRMDWQQRVSDAWAQVLLATNRPSQLATYDIQFRLPAPTGALTASLISPAAVLPPAATRAVGWLTAALLIVMGLAALFIFAVAKLRVFTRGAWNLVSNKTILDEAKIHLKRRDEISTLWRVLTVQYRWNQKNIRQRVAAIQQAAAEKAKEVRVLQARLELRQERLAAIGHEIRSPLASLMVRTQDRDDIQRYLHRIHNAIEAMLEAATVEDGIQSQQIVCQPLDLATYLQRLVENSVDLIVDLRYEGPVAGVKCAIDEFYFDTVLHHLLNNADRHRTPGTPITVRLTVQRDRGDAVLEVCNDGTLIPGERLKSIFLYKTSDSPEPRNKGLGLYSAKSYLMGMRATIAAENRQAGVAFVILLPLV